MAVTQTFGMEANSSLAPPTGSVDPVNLAYTPSLSDMQLVSRVRDLFARSRSERRPIVTQWSRNYTIMRNRTWALGAVPNMPRAEIPECRSVIAQWVAWLTDQRPQFDFVTSAQPYQQYSDYFQNVASDMQDCVDASWQTNLYERTVQQTMFDAAQFSIGILKTVWNAKLADGKGDFDVQRVDPYAFFPDPIVYEGNDPNYFIEARTISLQELDRRFPGAGERFEVEGYTDMIDQRPNMITGGSGMAPRTNSGAVSPATTSQWGLPGQARERAVRGDTGVTLLEAWLREHIVSDDPNDPERKRIFEYWRCVCIAGPYVLMDKRADEMFPFPIHPYDFIRPEDTGDFYDQSMVELVTPMQVSINRLLASLENNIALTGNPILLDASSSSRTTLRNTPGQRIPGKAGDTNATRWLDPPGLNPAMFQLIDFYIARMEHATGLSSISQGVAPGGRIASDVLDSVMESGFVRIRLAQRNLEYALRGVGEKACAFVAEFYTEPRRLTLIGPDGAETSKVLKGKHFYLREGDSQPTPMRFVVQVRAGSMLPTSRNARVAEIDQLFAMGAVDRSVVLEAHNIRNRAAIDARIADAEAKGTFQPPGARQRAGH